MKFLTPADWKDYELIDCGDFEKLERLGQYYVIRPESQAVWKRKLSEKEWIGMAHAHFKRTEQKASHRFGGEENGGWQFYKKMPENFTIQYQYKNTILKFKAALTSFGHIGIFPEQAENWKFILDFFEKKQAQNSKVLNIFAYTGGSSLAAKAAGAQVTHVDAVKQIVSWANENMQLSKLDNIRWIVEDAMKFLRREVRRGNTYNGIIMDPPAYGRGPDGERWVLEDGVSELMELTTKLLAPKDAFMIVNLYSLGWPSMLVENLIDSNFSYNGKEIGEFYLDAKSGYKLARGTFGRIVRQ